MMQSSENKVFTAADIERYHAGQLSEQERHALEKAALDDPFLADALEGYVYTPTPAADIQLLKKRLQEKLDDRTKVVPLFRQNWFRAAAAVVILAGAGWLAAKTFTPEKKEVANTPAPVQKKEDPRTTDNLQAADSFTLQLNTGASDTELITSVKPRVVTVEHQNTFSQQETVLSKEITAVQNPVVDSAPVVNTDLAAATETKKQEAGYNNTERYNTRAEVLNNRSAVPLDNNMFNNRSALPVENNNVFNSRQRLEVNRQQQDINFYKPLHRDSFVQEEIAQSRMKIIQGKSDTIKNFDVVLKPVDLPAAEMVVLNPGAKVVTRGPRVIIDTLEPAEGWAMFDDYVAHNLVTPEELKNKQVTGEVQLSFDVDPNGQPTNITVVKSLCSKCDEEAIRLLKEGPKWKKKKNKKGKITIKF